MKAKRPGPSIVLEQVKLDFSYSQFGAVPPDDGYERLLHDAMIGDTSLFHRADVGRGELADRHARSSTCGPRLPARDFPNYEAGSWGPRAADELLARDERRWVNPE